jgi:hypothetical protein
MGKNMGTMGEWFGNGWVATVEGRWGIRSGMGMVLEYMRNGKGTFGE